MLHQSINRKPSRRKITVWLTFFSLAGGEVILPQKAEEPKKEEKVKFSKTKKGKAIISIIVVLLVMIVAAGVFAIFYANNMLNKVTDDNKGGTDYEMSTYYNGMDFLKENFPTIEEASAGDVYSYKEYLKQWYQGGIEAYRIQEGRDHHDRYQPGGSTLFGTKDIDNLKVFNDVIEIGGLGNFSATDLSSVWPERRYLAPYRSVKIVRT